MHRQDKIARALATLVEIEQAVTEDTVKRFGIKAAQPGFIAGRIDNAVRIYCNNETAVAISNTGPV